MLLWYFFNAAYFRRAVIAAADSAGSSLRWLVIDLLPVTIIDATGLYTIDDIADTLHERGVVLVAAGWQTEWRISAESRNRSSEQRKVVIYSTLQEAVREYRAKHALAEATGAALGC